MTPTTTPAEPTDPSQQAGLPDESSGEDKLSSSVADLRRKAQQHSAAIMETLAVEHKKQLDRPDDNPTTADSSEPSQVDT